MNLTAAYLWLDVFEHANIHECDLALEETKNNSGY